MFSKSKLPNFLRSSTGVVGSRAHSIILQAAQHNPLSADCFFTEMRYKNSAGAGAPELYCRPNGIAYICGGAYITRGGYAHTQARMRSRSRSLPMTSHSLTSR